MCSIRHILSYMLKEPLMNKLMLNSSGKKDYYTCDENILNTLTNHLFDMYAPKKYAREI
jgi:hypothetical protein